MKIKRLAQVFVLLWASFLLLQNTAAQSLSPEQAYAAIPHARTVFDVSQSKLSTKNKEALKQLFALCDQGVVLRVEAMQAFAEKDKARLQYASLRYTGLIQAVQSLALPTELKNVQNLIARALQDHQQFYRIKQEQLGHQAWRLSDEAMQASQKLHQSYANLMQLFPEETAHNRQAFFDYLCALDFL